jgi:hypothetical protein
MTETELDLRLDALGCRSIHAGTSTDGVNYGGNYGYCASPGYKSSDPRCTFTLTLLGSKHELVVRMEDDMGRGYPGLQEKVAIVEESSKSAVYLYGHYADTRTKTQGMFAIVLEPLVDRS